MDVPAPDNIVAPLALQLYRAPLVGNINYRQAGVALRGADDADIGVEINGSDTYVTIVVHKIH